MNERFDYIITGAGAAGLSLVVRMIRSGKFSDKQILLVDRDDKSKNDRTWCFWESQPGFFEEIVHHRYNELWFHGSDFSLLNNIHPYVYKLIRGVDFYRYCLDIIRAAGNVKLIRANVDEIRSNEAETYVVLDGRRFDANYIFNSILFEKPEMRNGEYFLLQHFKGYLIQAPGPIFNPGQATLMDFRVEQNQGTSFVYVMPFDAQRALVEYTIFSQERLPDHAYDLALQHYMRNWLKLENYTIEEQEFGMIPMTNHDFPERDHHIMHIGTAGGQTKPSSGYTFNFIQKHSARILDALVKTGSPFYDQSVASKRFDFYDSTLLNILAKDKLKGAEIFSTLFRQNEMREIFAFLDNESNLGQELKLISVLPKRVFMQAAFEQIVSRF